MLSLRQDFDPTKIHSINRALNAQMEFYPYKKKTKMIEKQLFDLEKPKLAVDTLQLKSELNNSSHWIKSTVSSSSFQLLMNAFWCHVIGPLLLSYYLRIQRRMVFVATWY